MEHLLMEPNGNWRPWACEPNVTAQSPRPMAAPRDGTEWQHGEAHRRVFVLRDLSAATAGTATWHRALAAASCMGQAAGWGVWNS